MGIPGSNLLNQALKVIRPTVIKYLRFSGRTLTSERIYIDIYEPELDLVASVQAVSRSKYQDWGLDFQKNYIKIWAKANLLDLERDYSGDKFIYGGRTYKLIDQTTWFLQDGWASALAVEIKIGSDASATNPITPAPIVGGDGFND